MKKRYKLTIAYEGTHYVGWQWQKNGLSIQQVLEEAFLKITGEKDKQASVGRQAAGSPRREASSKELAEYSASRERAGGRGGEVSEAFPPYNARPMGAGRTDSGVHAIGQVAHVDISWEHPPEDLQRALNSILPEDVIISSVESVDKAFDAQKDARRKWYRYIVYNGRSAPLFERGKAWSVVPPLDLEAVRKAASVLEGEHDFASFQGAGATVKTTVRRLDRIEISEVQYPEWPCLDGSCRPETRQETGSRRQDGDFRASCLLLPASRFVSRATRLERETYILFDFYGEGFLKQMVRNITGTLIEVGLGKRSEKELKEILKARDRKKAGCSAPPYGLYLMKVFYD